MKIIINNAFNSDVNNDLYFISCIVEEGELNERDLLTYKNIPIGEVKEIESKNENTVVVLINLFSNVKELKISSLYGEELKVIKPQ